MENRIIVRSILSQFSFFVVNKTLIRVIGLNEAAILSVLVDSEKFATDKGLMKGNFFPCQLDFIMHQLNLGRRPVEGAINNLIKANIICDKKIGCPPVKHYKINCDKVLSLLSNGDSQFVQNEQIDLYEMNKLNCTECTTIKNNIYKNIIPPSEDKSSSPQGDVRQKKTGELNLSNIDSTFLPIIEKWLRYKKERKQTYKQTGLEMCYKKLLHLSDSNPAMAEAIIDEAIANNYQGFYALKDKDNGNSRNQRSCTGSPIHPDRGGIVLPFD